MSTLLTPLPETAGAGQPVSFLRALTRPAEHAWVCVLLLLAVCGVLFFYGLNAGDLWRTEGLRAILAAEMLRTGNWLVPVLYGEPMLTKPPGMYIAIALCSWPFGGVTEWTARLPSALAATATVFLVYWYFGRQLGRLGGFLAALILPLSPMWLEKATAAEIDMLQVFWTTAAILFLLRALEAEQKGRGGDKEKGRGGDKEKGRKGEEIKPTDGNPWETERPFQSHRTPSVGFVSPSPALLWWLLALLCVAGGFLTKWTTPAFFYVLAVPLLWWRGQLRLLVGWGHLLGVGLAALVGLGWIGAVIVQVGWPVFAATLEQEALQRLIPSYSPRPYPLGETLLHPFKLLLVGLPFSALALWTLKPGFFQLWDERGQKLLMALHCWTWPNMIFWSLPTEHTPRHSFPLFPGLSGLAAMVLLAWMTGKLPWPSARFRPQHLLIGILVLWLGAKVYYFQVIVPQRTAERQTAAKGHWLAQLVPVDQVLYLFRIKDEGILFYFGRPAQQLMEPDQVPATSGPWYCLVPLKEWESWRCGKNVEVVEQLVDSQGADRDDPEKGKMLLVRVQGGY